MYHPEIVKGVILGENYWLPWANKVMKTMAKYALVKSVVIWLYEYDIHSVMDSVHFIEII